MYAVIRTGGKQYRVAEGETLQIERVSKEMLNKGDELALNEVVAIGGDDTVTLGKPLVDGASVKATVVREMRGEKVFAYKKKKRKGHQKIHGHRQDLLEIKIQSIKA